MSSAKHGSGRGYLSWWIWLVYVVLFTAGVPWYWRTDDATMWFGIPAWVVVAVVASVAISVFTAWLLYGRWPDDDAGHHEGRSLGDSGENHGGNSGGKSS